MAYLADDDAVLAAVWSIITRRRSDRATAAIELLDDLLLGLGGIHRREHQLIVGGRVLNDDRQLLPRLGKATGLGFAIYLGNRRIAAHAPAEAGEAPEPGGYADAVIVEAVLRRREPFRAEVNRGGRRLLVACRPVLASDRPDDYGPIGIIEAFQDQDSLREHLAPAVRDAVRERRDEASDQADRSAAIVHFIEDVARRLQLLALNGNIIAAQAGDHGRAFRVVCRELSSLAEQTKEAVAEAQRLAPIGVDTTPDWEDEPLPGPDAGAADGGDSPTPASKRPTKID